MTKYVKNPGGGVHSVPDDFEVPADWHLDNPEDAFVDEAAAREAAPTLFGEEDPAVKKAEIHDGGEHVEAFDTEGVPAPPTSPDYVRPDEKVEAPVEESAPVAEEPAPAPAEEVPSGQADVQPTEEAPEV